MTRTTCAATTTATGQPCRKLAKPGATVCAWHDGRFDQRRQDQAAPRTCRVCRRTLPPRCFAVHTSNRHTGRTYRKHICRECERRARGLPPVRRYPPRYDGHGHIHCHDCDRYRDAELFAFPPSFGGRPVLYCRDCMRIRDRMRPKRRRGTPEWQADAERRARERKQRTAAEYESRTAFVAKAILTLRRRGFSKSEVARLVGTNVQSVIAWERRDRRPTPNVAARLGVVLRATAHRAIGPEPAGRGCRHHPHPELPMLLAQTRDDIARLPVRNSWTGDRGKERMAA